ncbi:MAG TPA: class I SAM-dependent methyltransferase [Chlorobiota bacterium]|nr:class I SAM-dependent methyltransferase [Chlorobiota bacterium]
MTDHRHHFYDQYTTVQTRTTDPAELRAIVHRTKVDLRHCVLPHVPTERTARIMDLGCGFGAFLSLLSDEGYQNAVGVDISPQQIAVAHQLGVTNARVASLRDALFGSSGFDCITMIDVIEHLTREEAIDTLNLISEVLRPGGTLILRTPNIDAAFGTVLSFGDLTHELHLNKLSTLELFATVNFHSVDIYPVPPVGGGILVRLLRSIVKPFVTLSERLAALVAGVQSNHRLTTPNMVIVAKTSVQSEAQRQSSR